MTWNLSIEGGGKARLVPLERRLTILGGEGCDVVVPDCSGPVAHLLWDGSRGRLTFLGSNLPEGPAIEVEIEPGTAVEVGGARVRIVAPEEEVVEGVVTEVVGERARDVALAALWVQARRSDPAIVRRWTESCHGAPGGFDSREAAAEILESPRGGGGEAEFAALAERALRNALLSTRRRRGRASLATKRAGAFLLSRLIVFVLYTATGAVFLVLLKRWTGFDVYLSLEPILPW